MRELVLPRKPSQRELLQLQQAQLERDLAEIEREVAETESQFVTGALVIVSGPRKGEALTEKGRRQRLHRLRALYAREKEARDTQIALEQQLGRLRRDEDEDARDWQLAELPNGNGNGDEPAPAGV